MATENPRAARTKLTAVCRFRSGSLTTNGSTWRFAEVAGGEFEAYLAFLVGRGRLHRLAGQLIAEQAAGQRCAVVELRPDRALDLLAAVIDPPRRIDHQPDRLQLDSWTWNVP